MSTRTIAITDTLHRYLVDRTLNEPPILADLREETRVLPGAGMQISPEQGQFMRLLVELIGARRCIEIGVFTGYSSTCVALALPEDGTLIACDINSDTTAIARRYWEKAGIANKIRLELRPANETLGALIAQGQGGQFDFAFIDADKGASRDYYEQCLTLLRRGGLVAIDNALWNGRVADPAMKDVDTVAIRELTAKVTRDVRVSSSLVPIGDGLLLARKV